MMRESLEQNSKYILSGSQSGKVVFSQSRKEQLNFSKTLDISSSTPVWLKIARIDNLFVSYWSADGSDWIAIRSEVIEMSNTII